MCTFSIDNSSGNVLILAAPGLPYCTQDEIPFVSTIEPSPVLLCDVVLWQVLESLGLDRI